MIDAKQPPPLYTGGYISLSAPKMLWRVQVTHDTWFQMQHAPNFFHRTMQRLLLGFVWTRLDKDK